jgi:uncharacterized protein DUF6328
MAKLEEKIENGLNETRILVLGTQALIGLNYRSAFEKGFERLPDPLQGLKLTGLLLLLLTLGLLISPAAYHRIVEEGNSSPRLHAFLTRMTWLALLPLAIGLGIDFFVATDRIVGRAAAVAAGFAASGAALLFWYGLEQVERIRLGKGRRINVIHDASVRQQATSLSERIRNVLTETRVVLPGAQALLGFQFLAVLTESFESLPHPVKFLHLGSLGAVALSTVLLMMPAAWHRIVEEGDNTERFHRIASVLVLAALFFLALGVSGDLFVVFEKVTRSMSESAIAAAGALLFFYALWFGYTGWARNRR